MAARGKLYVKRNDRTVHGELAKVNSPQLTRRKSQLATVDSLENVTLKMGRMEHGRWRVHKLKYLRLRGLNIVRRNASEDQFLVLRLWLSKLRKLAHDMLSGKYSIPRKEDEDSSNISDSTITVVSFLRILNFNCPTLNTEE
ncbi:hypothetical protein LIER_38587 [Lithospermum erythrorhizon]|uniref:Uncharacterized protein n=1 Tax=Lithospermum erythrorhizon TaxID=34254 RepID=A0AAV3Q232_LITER